MLTDILQLELIMVLLAAAGGWLRHKNVITDGGQECLTDLVMDLVLPCNIFLSFQTDADLETVKSMAVTVVISVVVMLLTALLGTVLYRRRDQREGSVFRYGLVNSNALFIGLPVIQSLLGDPGVLQLTIYMIFVRMFCWSYGLSLYTGVKSDWKSSLKRLMMNPCMIAAILGLAVMLLKIRLPGILDRTLNYVSDCLMMMSMVLIGAVLSKIHVKELLRGDVWRYTALRLVAVPGLVWLGCWLFRVPYIVTATCTLLSGMPSASLTAVLAARYQRDEELASLIVAVTTVVSTVTIPAWFMILNTTTA